MAFDLLEDILAFLYATSDREDPSLPVDGSSCPICGADLDADGEDKEMRCPQCGSEIPADDSELDA